MSEEQTESTAPSTESQEATEESVDVTVENVEPPADVSAHENDLKETDTGLEHKVETTGSPDQTSSPRTEQASDDQQLPSESPPADTSQDQPEDNLTSGDQREFSNEEPPGEVSEETPRESSDEAPDVTTSVEAPEEEKAPSDQIAVQEDVPVNQDDSVQEEAPKPAVSAHEEEAPINQDDSSHKETFTEEEETTITEDRHRLISSAVPLEDILEEEDEEIIDRDQLVEDIQEALAEKERLAAVNAQLQHKIAEYLIMRKKTEERADPGRNVTDQEKRYAQCMAALDSLKLEINEMQEAFQQQEQELKILREAKLAQVQQANAEFAEYKKEKASTAVHSRSGKKLTNQELDHYQSSEDRKEEGVIQVRLENIKLQNKIAKLEALIKEKEQLAEGLHMIDFEQLKINNVDLNEKIEERNEDILKLRRKVTSTVQVLTHVKEKLQFLQAENVEKRNKLKEMDTTVAKRRDHLTRMKQARDSLRMDNIRLRQRGGLVAHSALLRDYEERKDQNEELTSRLDSLQQHHSELSVKCDGLRRKIEQAKAIHSHHM